MQETRVQSLGWQDPLEKEMATHSSILAWKIPWSEEPDRLQSMGVLTLERQWCNPHLYLFTYLATWHSIRDFSSLRPGIKPVPPAVERRSLNTELPGGPQPIALN